jgi:hypothetical protein
VIGKDLTSVLLASDGTFLRFGREARDEYQQDLAGASLCARLCVRVQCSEPTHTDGNDSNLFFERFKMQLSQAGVAGKVDTS